MHPILQEMRSYIADGDPMAVVDSLLSFVESQMGPSSDRRKSYRFSAYRDELLLFSSDLVRIATQRRRRLESREYLDREERGVIASILDLITDIDGALAGPVPVQRQSMSHELSGAIPEKVVGRGNLQGFAWLSKGVEAGKPVCRVVTPNSIGTGFLVKGGKVITNNHVVPDAQTAGMTTVEFNFERDTSGILKPSKIYGVKSADFFTLPVPMDCSVLAVDATRDELSEWGNLSIMTASEPRPGDPVVIIQHPNGGEKQLAVTANEVVAVKDGRIAYLTDTLGGSSGAPVFDENWQVVALHRAGGALVKNAEGLHLRANEGVLFSALLQVNGLKQSLSLDWEN